METEETTVKVLPFCVALNWLEGNDPLPHAILDENDGKLIGQASSPRLANLFASAPALKAQNVLLLRELGKMTTFVAENIPDEFRQTRAIRVESAMKLIASCEQEGSE